MESQRQTVPGRRTAKDRRKSRARRNRRNIWTCGILAVTAAAIMSIACYIRWNDDKGPVQASRDIFPDGNAASGVLHAGEREPVDEGDYWVILNQIPTMEEGSRECNIRFENPAENHYSSRLTLYLKSTGQQIGQTELVDTGKYVETIQLSQSLEPGEYPIQAAIELFDGTEPSGEMSLEITLRVTAVQT